MTKKLDSQLAQLMKVFDAKEIRETEDLLFFKIGDRQQEIYKGFPLVIAVETTNHCNQKCMGCPQKDMTRPRQLMDHKLFKKIVDELAKYEVRTWFHFMGEPLTNPQIFDLLEYASGKDLNYFGISSNATLLNKDNIEKVLNSELHRFEISLDSLDPELQGQLRPGSCNPKSTIENAHEFFRIKNSRGQKLPISSIAIRELRENAHEIENFAAHWNKIVKEPDFVMSIRYDSWGGHESREHDIYEVPTKRLPCMKLWNTAIILVDGRLVTCNSMFDAQVVMGDTNTSSIKEIWNGREYQERRQKHIGGQFDLVSICAECDDWCREIQDVSHYKNWTYQHHRARGHEKKA